MVGLSILKHLDNLSDEELVLQWVQNPYYQAFCGEREFQWKYPCDSSDMTYFRKRKRKLALRFRQHPKNKNKARKATRRLKIIAGILLRELQRKLSEDVLKDKLDKFNLYSQVLKQKRQDKNKIYSLHELHIYCMSKGKLHKRYEFGTKASIAKTTTSNIIAGALAFEKNNYDGHTLSPVLA